MEEALFAEKERAQITLDCIGDAVICTDVDGNITFLNVVAEKLTGWSSREAAEADDASGTNARSPPVGGSVAPLELGTESCANVQRPTNRILIRRDGSEIPIEDSIAAMHDRQGRPAGIGSRVPRRERGAGDVGADCALRRA